MSANKYPSERQAARTLELSCPDVEAEVRENCAYLVSQRRMTIDEAIDYCRESTNGKASTTGQRQPQATSPKPPNSKPCATPIAKTGGGDAGSKQEITSPKVNGAGPKPSPSPQKREPTGVLPSGSNYKNRSGSGGGADDTEGKSEAAKNQAPLPRQQHLPSVGSSSGISTPKRAAPQRGREASGGTAEDSSKRPAEEADRSNAGTTVLPPGGAAGRQPLATQDGIRPRGSYTRAGDAAAPAISQRDQGDASPALGRSGSQPLRRSGEGLPRKLSSSAIEEPEQGGRSADSPPPVHSPNYVSQVERQAYLAKMDQMTHFYYGDDTSSFYDVVKAGNGDVFLFMTSMTGSRQVRDHCRLVENLLFLKLIPHHNVDIADNVNMQRVVRRWYQKATHRHLMPDMPLLFVGERLLGDYTTVQQYEDDGELEAMLMKIGCSVLRSSAMDHQAKKSAAIPEPDGSTPAVDSNPSARRLSSGTANDAGRPSVPPLAQQRTAAAAPTNGAGRAVGRGTATTERQTTAQPSRAEAPARSTAAASGTPKAAARYGAGSGERLPQIAPVHSIPPSQSSQTRLSQRA